MAKESEDVILEQVREHIAEFLKAVQAGKTGIAEFSSAKSLVEELMQNHAKQPAQYSQERELENTDASSAQIFMRPQLIELNMYYLRTVSSYKKL